MNKKPLIALSVLGAVALVLSAGSIGNVRAQVLIPSEGTLALRATTDMFNPQHIEVIGGNPVPVATQESRGLVQVGGGCSGVLLKNDVVLTAGHCIGNQQNIISTSANWGSGGSQTKFSKAIYKFADFQSPDGPDLALIYLSSPFTVNGSASGLVTQISNASSLDSLSADVFGLGLNAITSGFGTWRTASLTIQDSGNKTYTLRRSGSMQTIAPGDSGGPDFVGSSLTGIHSGVFLNCSDPTRCRDTVTEYLNGFSVNVPRFRDVISFIAEEQRWNSAFSTAYAEASKYEILATPWGWPEPVQMDSTTWAQAGRAALAICSKRGYARGKFNGHQLSDRRGLICINSGAVWFNVPASEIQAVGVNPPFVDDWTWSEAGWVASALCGKFLPESVGGHFDGHQATTFYGLVCYKDSAKYLNTPLIELGITDPNFQVSAIRWDAGSRLATDFCVQKGYQGGFLDGNQLNSHVGVICLGTLSGQTTVSSIPELSMDYTMGAPGSYFSVMGSNFSPSSEVQLTLNDKPLGTVVANATGNFKLVLSTMFAKDGQYLLRANKVSAPIAFEVNSNADIRDRTDTTSPLLSVLVRVMLPLVSR